MQNLFPSLFDGFVIVTFILSLISSFYSGFIESMCRSLPYVGGIIVALYNHQYIQKIIESYIPIPFLALLLSIIVSFAVAFFLLNIIVYLMPSKISDSSLMKALDRSLGLIFGALRSLVILSVVYLVLLPFFQQHISYENAAAMKTYPMLCKSSGFLLSLLPRDTLDTFKIYSRSTLADNCMPSTKNNSDDSQWNEK